MCVCVSAMCSCAVSGARSCFKVLGGKACALVGVANRCVLHAGMCCCKVQGHKNYANSQHAKQQKRTQTLNQRQSQDIAGKISNYKYVTLSTIVAA